SSASRMLKNLLPREKRAVGGGSGELCSTEGGRESPPSDQSSRVEKRAKRVFQHPASESAPSASADWRPAPTLEPSSGRSSWGRERTPRQNRSCSRSGGYCRR